MSHVFLVTLCYGAKLGLERPQFSCKLCTCGIFRLPRRKKDKTPPHNQRAAGSTDTLLAVYLEQALTLPVFFTPHALTAAIFDPVDCFEYVDRLAGHRRQGIPEDHNKISLAR